MGASPAADEKATPVLSTLRSRRFTAFVLAVVLIAAVGQTVLTLRRASPGNTDVTAGSVFIAPGKRVAVQLPSVDLLDGGRFDPATTAGHVTVVNFWASWCPPCFAEAPYLQQISHEKAIEGVMFLGVDSQESSPETGRGFVKDRGVEYPNVFDKDGAMQLAFSRRVQLGNLPVTVVLDREGRIAGVVYGEAHYTDLTALIDRVAGAAA